MRHSQELKSFIQSFPKSALTECILAGFEAVFESEEDRKEFTLEMFEETKKAYREQLVGGLGDGSDLDSFDQEQLFAGTKVEFEHSHDPMVAMEIATDHLTEIPDYYDWLAEMESDAKEPQ